MDESKEVQVEEVDKTPTQHRVERAERQTEERILNELGAKSLDEIKAKLQEADMSQKALQETQRELESASRKERLMRRLQDEKAFDPTVLVPFVDVEQLESDEDFDDAVNKLKQAKPNHFGVTTIESDTHVEQVKPADKNPVRVAELNGDFRAAIAESIRLSKNGGK